MGFPSIASVLWSASVLLLFVAALTDLNGRRIPDKVTIAVAAIGVAHGLLVRPGSAWLSLSRRGGRFLRARGPLPSPDHRGRRREAR